MRTDTHIRELTDDDAPTRRDPRAWAPPPDDWRERESRTSAEALALDPLWQCGEFVAELHHGEPHERQTRFSVCETTGRLSGSAVWRDRAGSMHMLSTLPTHADVDSAALELRDELEARLWSVRREEALDREHRRGLVAQARARFRVLR